MIELNGKKILVTFLMHLGDLTLTTPFIHALRKAAPDAHITFLADEKLKDVVLNNPYLDEVITIDKKGRDNSLLALMACSRKLSKLDFDVVIRFCRTHIRMSLWFPQIHQRNPMQSPLCAN